MASTASTALSRAAWVGVGGSEFSLTDSTGYNLVTLSGERVRKEIEQTRLYIGSGGSLVVLVAGLETSTVWDYIAEQFHQRGLSVCQHQLSGCGYHSEALASSSNRKRIAALKHAVNYSLAELRSHGAAPTQVHLVGHSFGTVFASEIAIDKAFWEPREIEVSSLGLLAAPVVFESGFLNTTARLYRFAGWGMNAAAGLVPFRISLNTYIRRMQAVYERTGFREHDRVLNEVLFYPYFPSKGLPQFIRGVLALRRRIRTIDRMIPRVVVMDAAYDVVLHPTRQVMPKGVKYIYLDNSGHAIPACRQADKLWECVK